VSRKQGARKSNLARRVIREVLALSFWAHAICFSGLLPVPRYVSPELPRYIFNSVLAVFIVNYSLFTDNGWWSVIFDLTYLYFLPFIYVGKLLWFLMMRFHKSVKSKIIWQSPRLITVPVTHPISSTKAQTPPPKATLEEETGTRFHQRIPRLVLKFSLLWSLLILTVNFKPFLVLAVAITLVGAARAIWGLWGLFSGGSSWVDKLENRTSGKINELIQQITQWDESSTPEEIIKAVNALKFWDSLLNFITGNTVILTKWAFAVSLLVSVPFYCYISFLFSCVYFGIGKITNIDFSLSNALVDSLFMPFAWSALPPSISLRFIAGLQATCVTVIGYNILFRHLGNRLEEITRAATKLNDPFQDKLLRTKISRAEVILSSTPKEKNVTESVS